MSESLRGIASRLYAARKACVDLPLPTTLHENLDLVSAYEIQHYYVDLLCADQPTSGFKAALTAPAAQAAFGFDEPVCGMLFANGLHSNGAIVERAAYRTPLLETEIGFILAADVVRPIESGEDLTLLVSSCMPMIELPDIGFGTRRASGLDLVAGNAASAGYIMGQPAHASDLNQVTVIFKRADEVLHTARAGEVMGDQWAALQWLINAVLAQGYALRAGQVLMTGSIGTLQPSLAGSYTADYGSFGRIEFTVV